MGRAILYQTVATIACVVLYHGAASAQTPDPAGGVSNLPDAVARSLSDNPNLQFQRGVEDLARSDLDSARALDNFRVDLGASAGVQNTDTNNPFAFQEGFGSLASAEVTASRPVWTSGRIPATIRGAQAGVSAAEAETEAIRQDLVLQTVTAYANLRRAREARRIREDNVAVSREQRQAADSRFRVGEITKTDVALAVAREEGSVAALAAAEAELAAAEAQFAEVVGEPAGVLAPLPQRPSLPPTVDEALEFATQYNPSVLSALDNLRASEEDVEAARAALRPQISIVGRASAQETWDDNIKDTSVSILGQASVPLYDGDQLRSQTRGAKARRTQAQASVDAVRRQVIRELTSAWSQKLAADRATQASRAQVFAAEEAYEGAKRELAAGQRTTLDVLDTEQDLFEAQLALLSAERDAYVAAYSVLAAMGALEPERIGLTANSSTDMP